MFFSTTCSQVSSLYLKNKNNNGNDTNKSLGKLPVGSIVLLKGATQNVIIIGFAPIEHGQAKVWDYLGAPYPIGVISSDKNLLFDNDMLLYIEIASVIISLWSNARVGRFLIENHSAIAASS